MESRPLLTAFLVALFSAGLAGCQHPSAAPQNQGAVMGGLQGTSSGLGAGENVGVPSGGNVTEMGLAPTQTPRPGLPVRIPPAMIQQVYRSTTADLNGDGFVTLEEVIAMKQAGLSDDQMVDRLRATREAYVLTAEQENFLLSQGISRFVIVQMETMNREERQEMLNAYPGSGSANPPGGVISLPLPAPPP